METKISRVNKVSIVSLPLSLSFFTQHRTSVSKNHRRTKYAFTNLNGIPKYADVRAYCSHVKMYCKRARLLSCHPRFFISLIISFEVPTKTKRKTKQCIANTIKTTIDLPLHLTERAPHSNKEGGTPYSRAAPFRFNAAEDYWFLTSKCEGHLRAALFRLNAIEYCVFRKSAYLFPT